MVLKIQTEIINFRSLLSTEFVQLTLGFGECNKETGQFELQFDSETGDSGQYQVIYTDYESMLVLYKCEEIENKKQYSSKYLIF
jgi:hypothetical protein